MVAKKTRTIRISEDIYKRLKIHVASIDDKITAFADRAILKELPAIKKK